MESSISLTAFRTNISTEPQVKLRRADYRRVTSQLCSIPNSSRQSQSEWTNSTRASRASSVSRVSRMTFDLLQPQEVARRESDPKWLRRELRCALWRDWLLLVGLIAAFAGLPAPAICWFGILSLRFYV